MACGLADGMEIKELSLFTRIDPPLSIKINFNFTGDKMTLLFTL